MISVAMIGEYTEANAIYTINTLVCQKDVEIELLISVNDLTFPVCNTINSLNAHLETSIKRVLLNISRGTEKEHLEYIRNHMTGSALLCLVNGSAIYQQDSLSKCMQDYHSEFVIGRNIIYNENDEFCGETPMTTDVEPALYGVLQQKNGSIILPKEFVQSDEFAQITEWNEGLASIVQAYSNLNEKNKIVVSQIPLLKTYSEKVMIIHNRDMKRFLENNIDIWREQVKNREIAINYSAYMEIRKLMELLVVDRHSIRPIAEKRIQEILSKSLEAEWAITNSDKALIVYLKELCIIRHRERLKWELFKFKLKLNYHKKTKVVFTVMEQSSWLSGLKDIYDVMTSQENAEYFDVDLVYVPLEVTETDIDGEYDKWKNSEYNVLKCEEYDIVKESPDIIIYTNPNKTIDCKWDTREVYKAIRKVIYIPNNMQIMQTTEEIKRYMCHLPIQVIAWKVLVYKKAYSEIIDKYAYHAANKLIVENSGYNIVESQPSEEETRDIAISLVNAIKKAMEF